MSGIRGTNKLRRTLRRIDPAVTQGIRDDIRDVSEAVKQDAINLAPVDEGDLVRAIDFRIGRDGLTSVIGPGAKAADIAGRKKKSRGNVFAAVARGIRLSRSNRDLLFEFFKGYWIEFGTKGNASNNIPPQSARPFMRPAWQLNRGFGVQRMRQSVSKALRKVSR